MGAMRLLFDGGRTTICWHDDINDNCANDNKYENDENDDNDDNRDDNEHDND